MSNAFALEPQRAPEVSSVHVLSLDKLDIERIAPGHGATMRTLYEHVRSTGEPLAFRGWVGREVKDALFVYHESAFLPPGEDDDTVDHILAVSIYVPKAPD